MKNTEKLNRLVLFMKARNYKTGTIKIYCMELRNFFTKVNEDSARISKQQIQDYMFSSFDKFSYQKRDQAVNAIKLYFKVIEDKELSETIIPRPKKQTYVPNVLTIEQVNAVIGNTQNLKHKAILYLIYDNGLRISEALNLNLMDVRTKCSEPHLIIRQAKHHSSRIVYMSNGCVELIREYYINERPQPTRYLFEGPTPGTQYSKTSVRNIFNAALKREGIRLRVRVHDLRHSFATHCLESGTDIYHLSGVLGHKSVKTTESTYAHMQPNKRRIIRPNDLRKNEPIKLRIAN